jgi:AhpC/TSA family/Disulphide bond corrector protein DsbC
LVELEHSRQQFEKLGVGIAAVSYDSVAILHNFAERRAIHFPLLSDADSKIIRSAGLLNETIPRQSPFFGIPNPGTFILDAKGVIKAKYFEEDFRERFTAAGILTRQFGVTTGAGAHEVIGKQLTAVASASNYVVREGQRVALVLDIELKPKMHVYAPGVEGYIPIVWKMKESPAFVAHDVTLPRSKMLHLPAIDETVPVYEGKFRIERDITIAPEPKVKPLPDASGQFVVEGTLQYQACDDRMCYVPQELKLGWTFQLEGHDRERAPAELRRKAR